MYIIWHDNSPEENLDAVEDCTPISVLVWAIFQVKNGQNCKNEPQNLLDDPKNFKTRNFFLKGFKMVQFAKLTQ